MTQSSKTKADRNVNKVIRNTVLAEQQQLCLFHNRTAHSLCQDSNEQEIVETMAYLGGKLAKERGTTIFVKVPLGKPSWKAVYWYPQTW